MHISNVITTQVLRFCFCLQENGDWSDWVYQDDNASFVPEVAVPVLSNTISNEAEALREEAAEHYRLRQEYIQKAQAAYCRGMRDVASFYAQQVSCAFLSLHLYKFLCPL